MAPPGLTALGAKDSACDRLRLTGGLRAFALGRYIVPLRWRGTAPFGGAIFYAAFGGENRTAGLRPSENHTTALRALEMHSPLPASRDFPRKRGQNNPCLL